MKNIKGEMVKRPEANLLKENWSQYLELAKEYGLTAKSKSLIKGKTASREEDSPADEYFRKRRLRMNKPYYRYAQEVIEGKIVAGEFIRSACERFFLLWRMIGMNSGKTRWMT